MTATSDHYRLVFCAGPTTLSELYYDNYEESLQDFLTFARMYWSSTNDDIFDLDLNGVLELTGHGEKQACVIGTARQNIWWRRVEAGTETFSLN